MGLPFYLESPGYDWYSNVPVVTLDVETTNIAKGDPREPTNKIVLGSVKRDSGRVSTYSGLELENRLADIASAPCVLVAHHAKFELGWLLREGIAIDQILVHDTMVAEYVIAGNRKVSLDLDSVGQRYGLGGKDPVVDSLISGGVCPSSIPEDWLRARCERDVETTYGVYLAQRAYFAEHPKLAQVFFTRCIVTPVLAAIEAEGMQLDAERVYAEYERVVRERRAAAAELKERFGDINFRSGKQVAKLLYDDLKFEELTNSRGEPKRTPDGRKMTDSDTLTALRAVTPEQKAFVKMRGEFSSLDAMLSKSMAFFEEVCQTRQGRFLGQYNQTVTQTHRLSSSGKPIECRDKKRRGIQMQNLPRQYKKLLRAKSPVNLLVETDGAQLEFRVAGHVGRDTQVLEDVRTGADIHRFTASVMTGIPEDKVTDKQRTAAKAETFGPLYGRTSGTKKQKAYIQAFQKKYKGVNAAQNAWVAEAMRTGKVELENGLVFYFPGTTTRADGSVVNRTNIYNYGIQSLATADIIPISLVYTYWTTRDYATIVNTVHDSVVAEVPPEFIDRYRQDSLQCWGPRTNEYLRKVYGITLFVPLGMGMKAARNWGDTAKEEKFTLEAE